MSSRSAFKPFWNEIVSLWSTAGRSLFWFNHLWLINVVEWVLQHRQLHEFSHWFANMTTKKNKTTLPHKPLFMHWTKKWKPPSDLLCKVSDLLENMHQEELSLTNADVTQRSSQVLTSMQHGSSAVGGHSCLGFAFWQAKQQTSVTAAQDQNTHNNKHNRKGSMHDRFACSTNNWELTKLQLKVTFCIRLPRSREMRHPILLAAVPQQPSWKAPGNVASFQTRSCTFENKSSV